MEDQPSEEGELPGSPHEAEGEEIDGGSPIDEARGGPEATALAMEAEEIRRLVDAGAGSPEAIRELAARLREHRAREEALWRAEIKPVLAKAGKGRFRGHGASVSEPAPTRAESSMSNSLILGLVLLGLVLVVVIAANTTVWLLVLPLVALIAWAWHQGRDSTP
jgi:uncharacterized protein YoaH (UPF0181 family)